MENKFDETTRTQSLLFNSSLISAYKLPESEDINSLLDAESRVIYDVKIVKCGSYYQVYKFSDCKSKNNDRDIDLTPKVSMLDVDTENLYKQSSRGEVRSISMANAIRSKFNCQRIAKSNTDVWESFITLTFSDDNDINICDISECNKIFHSWASNIKRLKKDFKYIAVPEFQKERGKKYGVEAVHYHVLSNLGKNDIPNIIIPQKIKTGKAVHCSTLYDVKYWSRGFARVDFVKSDYKKIYGYISKYMTDDIDNKLFGKHRYFYSQSLVKPVVEYLNLSDPKHYEYFNSLLSSLNVQYQSIYKDIYTKTDIDFFELN